MQWKWLYIFMLHVALRLLKYDVQNSLPLPGPWCCTHHSKYLTEVQNNGVVGLCDISLVSPEELTEKLRVHNRHGVKIQDGDRCKEDRCKGGRCEGCLLRRLENVFIERFSSLPLFQIRNDVIKYIVERRLLEKTSIKTFSELLIWHVYKTLYKWFMFLS